MDEHTRENSGPVAGSPAPSAGTLRGTDLTLTALMAALTGVLAWISIPLPVLSVPFTGQTVGVMLAGLLLGPRLGALSMILYVMMGAMGLPVFAGGQSGLGVLMGPTGGFLAGFVACALVSGAAARRLERRPRDLAIALVPGVTALFACGAAWPWMLGLSPGKILWVFVLPFLPLEIMKVMLVAPLANRLLSSLPALPGNLRRNCTHVATPR